MSLSVIRMVARIRVEDEDSVDLSGNTGFTLPRIMGELGDDITELNLSDCSLTGNALCSQAQARTIITIATAAAPGAAATTIM